MSPSARSDRNGGADRDRTDDLLNANQALFQLSYGPNDTGHNRRKNRTSGNEGQCPSKTILCDQ